MARVLQSIHLMEASMVSRPCILLIASMLAHVSHTQEQTRLVVCHCLNIDLSKWKHSSLSPCIVPGVCSIGNFSAQEVHKSIVLEHYSQL